jgi:ribulose-phosphate 3-epimerase
MKVSASIYSDKKRTLRDCVTELEKHGADMLHVDCKDNEAVFEDIAFIRTFSKLPIDLHIISPNPAPFIKRAVALRVEYIAVQAEQIDELPAIDSLTSTLGLSIITTTTLDVIETKGRHCSFVQLMTTVPGESSAL